MDLKFSEAPGRRCKRGEPIFKVQEKNIDICLSTPPSPGLPSDQPSLTDRLPVTGTGCACIRSIRLDTQTREEPDGRGRNEGGLLRPVLVGGAGGALEPRQSPGRGMPCAGIRQPSVPLAPTAPLPSRNAPAVQGQSKIIPCPHLGPRSHFRLVGRVVGCSPANRVR